MFAYPSSVAARCPTYYYRVQAIDDGFGVPHEQSYNTSSLLGMVERRQDPASSYRRNRAHLPRFRQCPCGNHPLQLRQRYSRCELHIHGHL